MACRLPAEEEIVTKDLRSFLDFLRREHPEEILEIKSQVDLEYDMTTYVMELERKGKFPLLFFHDVKGYPFPVVVNTFASRRRIGHGIGLEEKELISGWKARSSDRIPPQPIEDAPVKEVIQLGDEVDLNNYPIPVHFEIDGGRYITGGVAIAKDPDTGVGNLNFTRMQVHGPRTLGASMHSRGDLWDFQRRQEERGKPLEIAVAIGVHPAISVAGATNLPITEDEMALAGALMGEGVPVVQAETVDLLVPAQAEMIIEGQILPNTFEDEGPLGEYTGYASSRSTRNVFQVTAVTHRKDMIYQDIVPGASAEHLNLSKVSRIPRTFDSVKAVFPNVVDMNYPMSGTHYHCYVSLKQTIEGQARQVMMLIFGLDPYIKHIIAVDSDVDVFDEKQVLWALATRFQADRDLFVVPGLPSNLLDPSLEGKVGAKMGMDATMGLDTPAIPIQISSESIQKIRKELKDLGLE
ncbi:MAG TPA: UbiD family decarboxylase [Chloroflexi bacterium]|nr:UbiD family decarboxylase [Chloroflexota bacterium]